MICGSSHGIDYLPFTLGKTVSTDICIYEVGLIIGKEGEIFTMIKMNNKEEEALKCLQHIKAGCCPNVFISGRSIPILERLGLQTVKELEKHGAIDFRGICTYFTIMMPYYNSKVDANSFINHLLNSISIARDCYDRYQGLVLLEFDTKWSREGKNSYLDVFWDFVRKSNNLRFVLLFPIDNEKADTDSFFEELFRCGPCLRIKNELATVHQNVSYFNGIATEKGYMVSEEARQYLYQRVKERDELTMDSTNVMTRLLDQIIFIKELERSKDRKIEVTDICKYLPERKTVSVKHPIGFITRE